MPQASQLPSNSSKSYSQILKASSIVGGAQGISLLLGMVRMKFVAILIGPLGVGLVGTYQVIQSMVATVSGFGIQTSAVRDVSIAVANGDKESIGRIILTLRRISLFTGLLGAFVMVALAKVLSRYTFGSDEYVIEIAMLGVTILLGNIQGGQIALIQGMRRIGDLARLNVIGAVAGTIVSICLYTLLGLRGIIPALLLLALIQLIASWYFARKIAVPKVAMSWMESLSAAGGMVRLGFALMMSAMLVIIVAYQTRVFITTEVSLEAVGIFSAAFALSGMFINFVLGAMGADYYPRLTAISNDKMEMNKLVNEQTEIGLLLAVPGLVATLSLAPWIIKVFYTSEFLPAVGLLQWFILGCLGRVISWPMGFTLLALGKGKWFVTTEIAANLIHLSLVWAGLFVFGLEGVSIAFFTLYVLYVVGMLMVCHHLTGFFWSSTTLELLIFLLPVVALTFIAVRFLPIGPATLVGVVILFVTSLFCLRGLVQRIGYEHRIVQMAFKVPGLRYVCGL
jgi:antigen flippase